MTINATFKRIYAALLLTLLVAAHGGQQVHIYTEDPLRFAAFSGDLMPDNGADSAVAAKCVVCEFHFFPFLQDADTGHVFYSRMLAVVLPEATRCKCCDAVSAVSLRAPPVA